MGKTEFRIGELVGNAWPRLPTCCCVDTGSSMAGAPVAELNAGVARLFGALKGDEVALRLIEMAVVKFGSRAEKVMDFRSVGGLEPSRFSASGATAMGAGVLLALDLIESRRKTYREAGIHCFCPWLVLMTSGYPTDCIDEAAGRAAEQVEKRKLAVFPFGVGKGADMSVLARFSPRLRPCRLEGFDFGELLGWPGVVVPPRRITPARGLPLDIEGIAGWADI